MRKGIHHALSFLTLLLLEGCLSDSSRVADGGTGSETTNHIAGMVIGEDGLPAARTRIQLVPSAFNPLLDTVASAMQDTTDEEGRFEISDPVPGNYRVEAHQGASGKRALLGTFAHGDRAQSVADIRLQAAGTLRVSLPDSLWLAGGYVFIPGTTFKAMIGESHINTLAPIPAMVIPSLAYARDPRSDPRILARDVEVRAGDTAWVKLDAKPDTVPKVDSIPKVDSAAAVQSQAVFELNTTASAAGVQADVQGFPLLVRLDSSNFDFSRAPADGAGIEFADSIGRALPFEVERWNAGLRKAEIWVRMDVVKGAAVTRALIMKWPQPGGAASIDRSTPGQVFTSRDGFIGVWHMGGEGSRRKDATGLRDGLASGFDGDEAGEGMVGGADWLDAIDDVVDLGSANVPARFMISVWVNPGPGNTTGRVLGKSAVGYGIGWIYTLHIGTDLQRPFFGMATQEGGPVLLPVSGPASSWSLIGGIYDGATAMAYSDGTVRSSHAFTPLLPQNDLSALLGASDLAGMDKYTGAVDEVRIESTARSTSWIKLCYENQRAGQVLVRRVP